MVTKYERLLWYIIITQVVVLSTVSWIPQGGQLSAS
ncbi:hypothetical protein BVRB_7g177930 [Beta vulgaris subsp. vulgaris]|nr:hypothetical protein BVRB_7g177930 [Beta vulgaris subsp. vulgaris]